ncbi:hypothetical protein [Leptolyngbya sp. 7M]|uniref:hypothetical protein n=1 Tax=Leptolyngbya sp. 7M TaxID=2812896 RepID=UPI001B8B527E|nr:hypothetical protein [Leptolyngbya sp. 7M]QYO66052.1 hypothetical protein JVX88_04420 [Leptolyngbya sp. 7M]
MFEIPTAIFVAIGFACLIFAILIYFVFRLLKRSVRMAIRLTIIATVLFAVMATVITVFFLVSKGDAAKPVRETNSRKK